MKYSKRQEAMIDVGMTLCFECQKGYNGDQSCGTMGTTKSSTKSYSGCFLGRKSEDNERNRINAG